METVLVNSVVAFVISFKMTIFCNLELQDYFGPKKKFKQVSSVVCLGRHDNLMIGNACLTMNFFFSLSNT